MSVLEESSQIVGRGSESCGHVAWASWDDSDARWSTLWLAHVSDGLGGLKTGAKREGLRAERPALSTKSHA